MGSIASGVGDIVMGAIGGMQEGQAANEEWFTNKALAQYGARLARLKGAEEEGELRAAGTQVAEAQKLAYADAGVDPTVGTAAAVQADTGAMAELDAQTAKNNAARAAWGFKVQEEKAHRDYQTRANNAQNKMIGSFITGAGKIGGGIAGLF